MVHSTGIDVFELTRSWAEIPSTTGSEIEILRLVETYLEARGWPVSRITVDDSRYNILAGKTAGQLLLTTHLDTVPPHMAARAEGDHLFGRGVADAKGAAAAMVAAAESMRSTPDLSLLFVVGEEGDSDGAKAAVSSGLRFDYVLNGEPTDNTFVSWQKGTLRVELRASGQACHSGYPDKGESAVHRLIQILSSLLARDWESSVELGSTTLNVGEISGGIADNVLAPEATARLMFRTVSQWTVLLDELKSVVGDEVEIGVGGGSDPLKLFCPHGYPSKSVAFGSDLSYLKEIGKPMMLGPGSIMEAHSANESITRQQLESAVKKYEEIIRLIHAEETP